MQPELKRDLEIVNDYLREYKNSLIRIEQNEENHIHKHYDYKNEIVRETVCSVYNNIFDEAIDIINGGIDVLQKLVECKTIVEIEEIYNKIKSGRDVWDYIIEDDTDINQG